MAWSQGNGGPIPPCPFLLRKSKFTHAKGAKAGTGDEGIRDSGVKGGPIPPCAVTAKANLPRRWVFRLIAEARINNAVALQRQPYLGVECLGRVRFASGPFGGLEVYCRPNIWPVLRVGDQTSTHWIGINIGPLLT